VTMHATGSFKITSWDEKPFSEVAGGGKLTHASVVKTYAGEIQGVGTLHYLMTYRLDGSAEFHGYERFVGQVRDRVGSFVLQHRGIFANGKANEVSSVVQDSGTGALIGLRGHSEFSAAHQQEYPVTLDYHFG